MSLPAFPRRPDGGGGSSSDLTRFNSERQFKPFVYLNGRWSRTGVPSRMNPTVSWPDLMRPSNFVERVLRGTMDPRVKPGVTTEQKEKSRLSAGPSLLWSGSTPNYFPPFPAD